MRGGQMCKCTSHEERCERLDTEGMRKGRGRPNKYWTEMIRQDMTQLQFIDDIIIIGEYGFETLISIDDHPFHRCYTE